MILTKARLVFGKAICLTFMGLVCIAEIPGQREYTKEVSDRSKETKDNPLSFKILSRDFENESFVVLVTKMFPLGGWTGGDIKEIYCHL